eukprot:354316-Chlamydomonas_euryale.AAC.11
MSRCARTKCCQSVVLRNSWWCVQRVQGLETTSAHRCARSCPSRGAACAVRHSDTNLDFDTKLIMQGIHLYCYKFDLYTPKKTV